MQGVFDYLVCDEIHEEKADTSARANALGALVASCRKVIGMTGTLIGGKASHVRSLLFRLSPRSLKAENLAWQDDMEFSRRYGRVDTIITERTKAGDDNRRSHGKNTVKRQAEQPGIMPTLYGRHLIGSTKPAMTCSPCGRLPAAPGGSARSIPAACTTCTTPKPCRPGRWRSALKYVAFSPLGQSSWMPP
jgi:hypothetical protein